MIPVATIARAAVADDVAEHARLVERSLAQMIRAGHRYAMVPDDLADAGLLELVLGYLEVEFGALDGRFGNLCGALHRDAPDVTWVCLVARCPARADWRPVGLVTADHGWPGPAARDRERAALLEQTDPIARLERRALMALEGPSAFDHLACDMPTA